MKKINRVSIIGAGRVGCALAKALSDHEFAIAEIIDRDEEKLAQAKKFLTAENLTTSFLEMEPADAIFLCVSDDEISVVAGQVAQVFHEKNIPEFAFHCSGALPADVLQPLAERGVKIASMHPLQTFSGFENDAEKMSGIFWALEGEGAAISAAKNIVHRLNGQFIVLPKSAKPIHHLACVFASNYLNFLLSLVVELYAEIGINEKKALAMIVPLAQTTLENIGADGLQSSLTGPAARGDVRTIEEHLKILSDKFPDLENIYKSLAKRIFTYPTVSSGMSDSAIRQMKKLFNQ